MNYDYYYGDYYNDYYNPFGAIAAVGVALLIAVVAGAVLYFTFFNKKNEGKYKGKKEKFYNFMTFNKFYIEDLMKFVYIISAFAITGIAVGLLISGSFVSAVSLFAVGNVGLRIGFELIMMFIILCKKTVSMDKKLDGIAKYYDDGYDEFCGEPQANDEESYGWEADLEEAMSCGGACGSCNVDCDSREEAEFAEEPAEEDGACEEASTLAEVENKEKM